MKPRKEALILNIPTLSDSVVSMHPIKRTSNTSSLPSYCYQKSFYTLWEVWNGDITRDDSLYSANYAALLDFWAIVWWSRESIKFHLHLEVSWWEIQELTSWYPQQQVCDKTFDPKVLLKTKNWKMWNQQLCYFWHDSLCFWEHRLTKQRPHPYKKIRVFSWFFSKYAVLFG